jgi:hypothetical protein
VQCELKTLKIEELIGWTIRQNRRISLLENEVYIYFTNQRKWRKT